MRVFWLDAFFWRVLLGVLIPVGCAGASTWIYSSTSDRMSARKLLSAVAVSDNQLALRFPYQGKNHVTVLLRQWDGEWPRVAIALDRGQHACDECTLRIRFDDDTEPQVFSTLGAADGDTRVVFLRDGQRFVERAQTARRFRVELVVYQNGTQIGDFRFRRTLRSEFAVAATGESQVRQDMDIESGCHVQKDFIDCLEAVRQCLSSAKTEAQRMACKPDMNRAQPQ